MLALVVELFDFLALNFNLDSTEVEVLVVVGHLHHPLKLVQRHNLLDSVDKILGLASILFEIVDVEGIALGLSLMGKYTRLKEFVHLRPPPFDELRPQVVI